MTIFKNQLNKYGIPMIWLGEAGGQRIPDLQDSGRMLFSGVGSEDKRFPGKCSGPTDLCGSLF